MTLQDFINQQIEEQKALAFWEDSLEAIQQQAYEVASQISSEEWAFGDAGPGAYADLAGRHSDVAYYEAQVAKFYP